MKQRIAPVILLALLLISGTLVIACGEESSTAASEDTSKDLLIGQSAQTPEQSVTVISADKVYSYEWNDSYSHEPYTEEAATGNVFIIINVRINNTSDASMYANNYNFTIIDTNGHKYDHGFYRGDDVFDSQVIYEGQQASGKILFEVPDSATDLKVQYEFDTQDTKSASWII